MTLTHWGRLAYMSRYTNIVGSDNGLSPGRHQANIGNNAVILLIRPLGKNKFLIEIHTFTFKKMNVEMSSAKWWPFCLGLNVFNLHTLQRCFVSFVVVSSISSALVDWCDLSSISLSVASFIVRQSHYINEPALHWRHNGHDSVSNHQPHDCLLNRLLRRRSKKISKLRVTGLRWIPRTNGQ